MISQDTPAAGGVIFRSLVEHVANCENIMMEQLVAYSSLKARLKIGRLRVRAPPVARLKTPPKNLQSLYSAALPTKKEEVVITAS